MDYLYDLRRASPKGSTLGNYIPNYACSVQARNDSVVIFFRENESLCGPIGAGDHHDSIHHAVHMPLLQGDRLQFMTIRRRGLKRDELLSAINAFTFLRPRRHR